MHRRSLSRALLGVALAVLAAMPLGGCATSACGDTSSDASNCGVCGVTCGGAACVAGVCQPLVLATTSAVPEAVAVDATHVYWLEWLENEPSSMWGTAATARRALVSGGETTTLTANVGPSPVGGAVTVDTTSFYWADTIRGAVMKLPLAGGAPISIGDTGCASVTGVVSTGKSVFWAVGNCMSGGGGPATITTSGVDGGTGTAIATDAGSPCAITVDAKNVYWTSNKDGGVSYAIQQAPRTGGMPTSIAEGLGTSCAIAVDGTSVYWTSTPTDTTAPGAVMKVAIGGGTPTALAPNQQGASSIAVDATHVYWANADTTPPSGAGSVMKVALAGGTPTVLAAGQAPVSLALDDTSVYWANVGSTNGSIVKVAK